MRRIVLAAFTLIVLAACQPTTTEFTEEQKAAIADTVRQLADAFLVDMKALNLDGAMAAYAPEFVWAENGVLGARSDSILSAWRDAFASVREASGDWGEVHIKVLSPAAVVFTASFNWAVVDTAGVATGSNGVWTTVWERTVEGWKIVHGHESYQPTPEPM